MSFLIDTNILIYHTTGSVIAKEFLANIIASKAFNISMITKIEFLGWHAQTPDGFQRCQQLIKLSNVLPITEEVADKAIDLRRHRNVKLADAIIAATAAINGLKLAARNPDDFKGLTALQIVNPFE